MKTTKKAKADSFKNGDVNQVTDSFWIGSNEDKPTILYDGMFNYQLGDSTTNGVYLYIDRSSYLEQQYNSNNVYMITFGAVVGGVNSSGNYFYDYFYWDKGLNYPDSDIMKYVMYGRSGQIVRFIDISYRFVNDSTTNNRNSIKIFIDVYGNLADNPNGNILLIDTITGWHELDYFDSSGYSWYNDVKDNYSHYSNVNAFKMVAANGSYGGSYQDGYNAGLNVASSQAYENGYNDGISTSWGKSSISQLITTVVQSPIDFISTVFNVDIFGFNVSGLIFAFFSLGITIFIFNIILKFWK